MAHNTADSAWIDCNALRRQPAADRNQRGQTGVGMNDNAPAGLAEHFKRLIRENGPISLAQYMGESNARYYTSRNPLGEDGDFITAPEVSQVFGELIGLWLADIWVRAGTPETVYYVELGPGRGTLASDALRAAERDRHGWIMDTYLLARTGG